MSSWQGLDDALGKSFFLLSFDGRKAEERTIDRLSGDFQIRVGDYP